MKTRMLVLFLIAVMLISLSGCARGASGARVNAAENTTDRRAESGQIPASDAIAPTETPVPTPEAPAVQPTDAAAIRLTPEEAEAIALAHAGQNAEAVSYLRTEPDYDRGIPEYDVEFRVDRWEYEYEIHAETGEILSWDKDWDD